MSEKTEKNEKVKKAKNPDMQYRIRVLAASATLTAMSVVIGIVCKQYLTFGGGSQRITFENLPIIIAGLLFGPVVGGIVGFVGDLVSCIFAGQTPFPLISVGAIAVGVVSGVISKYVMKKDGILKVIVAALSAHIVGPVIIKTYALSILMKSGFWVQFGLRIPFCAIVMTIETILLIVLFKNRYFRKITGRFEK